MAAIVVNLQQQLGLKAKTTPEIWCCGGISFCKYVFFLLHTGEKHGCMFCVSGLFICLQVKYSGFEVAADAFVRIYFGLSDKAFFFFANDI